MGVVMAGGIFTGANPTYVVGESAHQVKDSDALYLISAEASLDTALEAADMIGLSKDRIFVFNNLIYDGNGEGKKGLSILG